MKNPEENLLPSSSDQTSNLTPSEFLSQFSEEDKVKIMAHYIQTHYPQPLSSESKKLLNRIAQFIKKQSEAARMGYIKSTGAIQFRYYLYHQIAFTNTFIPCSLDFTFFDFG